MYFWNIEKLKNDLIAKPMSDKDALPYLITTLLLYVASQYAPKPVHFGNLDYSILAISISSIFVGTFWLYKKIMAMQANSFYNVIFPLAGLC